MFAGMPTLETVYIETSVVSYLVAQPSRNPITTLRQQLRKEWWTNQREKFVRVISQEVIAEALEGDSSAAQKRMAALQGLPLISGGLRARTLVAQLLQHDLFPPNAEADAVHLAHATCMPVDYLLTWNYRHLANAVVLNRLEKFLKAHGLRLPRVCTPEELMGI
jgi:hypothetical protein